MGYATIEEIKLRDGRYLNDRLATYLIPTALDAPHIRSILCYLPIAAPGPLPAADYMIGNEVAFDTIDDFNSAMASSSISTTFRAQRCANN